MARILFLAANPKDAPRARLDKEVATIEERIRITDMRDLFEVKSQMALRTRDLHAALLQHKPDIVHFAGLGTLSGEILLEDEFGESLPISAEVIGEVFSILRDNICCVVINARYAELQVQAIAEHVGCVVSMSKMVSDRAAICFAAAFYLALGFGRTVRTAFDLARHQLKLDRLEQEVCPVLLTSRSKSADFVITDSRGSEFLTSVAPFKLADGGSNARGQTARQLGYLKDLAAIPILEQRWPMEVDPTVRYWLAIAIGEIGGEQAHKTLCRLKQTEQDRFARSGLNEALNSLTQATS
jgi:hypothetical protein